MTQQFSLVLRIQTLGGDVVRNATVAAGDFDYLMKRAAAEVRAFERDYHRPATFSVARYCVDTFPNVGCRIRDVCADTANGDVNQDMLPGVNLLVKSILRGSQIA